MKKFVLIIVGLLCLLSCSEKKTLTLWSSNSEMASAVELFNNSDSEYRIIYKFKKNLTSTFLNSVKKPDIIVGCGLQNREVKDEMGDLTELFSSISLKHATPLTGESIRLDGEIRLLPLSYTLRCVVFRKESLGEIKRKNNISIENMKELSLAFNDSNNNRVGYSPFWENDFANTLLKLFSLDFNLNDQGKLSWSVKNLTVALDYLKTWDKENGGRETMADFDIKYMYEFPIRILKDKRILFTTLDSNDYLTLSDKMRRGLDFLYLSKENEYSAENVIYGAAYNDKDSLPGARAFFSWFLERGTQENIIKTSLTDKTGDYAILGGFSTLDGINEQILPRYYPNLQGKIAGTEFLKKELEKPADFKRIKKEVLELWLKEAIEDNEIPLEQSLKNWEKIRIPD